ncbi:arginine--tRNA ligase [Candidatus Acetothermia bacterium]|jgi:arginyl-tRNA synthetase|nr:arginine--tRNA ligase [Candidatus Acetothermia bacterium]MCI2427136.1 arginine--tRNA ligase [Candidatus Acetothermia bacterium]MCI2428738.1 arginine--tRNA ligase [Candidatus Acetothermia bacterium]
MLKSFVHSLLKSAWQDFDHNRSSEVIEIEVSRADRPEFGDFTSNIALTSAAIKGMSPRELAQQIINRLPHEGIKRLEIAGPGFINFFLSDEVFQRALRGIILAGERFSQSSHGNGERVQIEFVSSNPTGPLTIGHGRQAVLGDVLASLYSAIGYQVSREYYFNDEGEQVNMLTRSLWARYRQVWGEEEPLPEQGYHGEYLVKIAQNLKERLHKPLPHFDTAAAQLFKEEALSQMIACIKDDLDLLGVQFDNWFSEATLHKSGEVKRALEMLDEKGGIYEADGAIWLAAEKYGGTKDMVLIRSDGRPTYLMVDIAYHINKWNRKFNYVINIQGADHHAQQLNMKAAMRILGYPEDFLTYGLHQFVTVKEQDGVKKMSTRAGRFIELRTMIEDLGKDVVRYFMVARKPESHLELDYALAKQQTMDNPVYYIQYSYTRCASIFRNAGKFIPQRWEEVDLSLITQPVELDIICLLDRFPEVVKEAALTFAPHLVAEYALTLAGKFHRYYTDFRILTADQTLTQGRLALLWGVQSVLRQTLQLLGISAPEEM